MTNFKQKHYKSGGETTKDKHSQNNRWNDFMEKVKHETPLTYSENKK